MVSVYYKELSVIDLSLHLKKHKTKMNKKCENNKKKEIQQLLNLKDLIGRIKKNTKRCNETEKKK